MAVVGSVVVPGYLEIWTFQMPARPLATSWCPVIRMRIAVPCLEAWCQDWGFVAGFPHSFLLAKELQSCFVSLGTVDHKCSSVSGGCGTPHEGHAGDSSPNCLWRRTAFGMARTRYRHQRVRAVVWIWARQSFATGLQMIQNEFFEWGWGFGRSRFNLVAKKMFKKEDCTQSNLSRWW